MNEENFVMYCKSYKKDFHVACRMIESFNRYNDEGIQMYISCPSDDYGVFLTFDQGNVHVIKDEDFLGKDIALRTGTNLSIGYINQEICKLCFWKTGITENYLCIDSDTEFIRKFSYKDFMSSEHVPYTTLIMDRDLSVEREYQPYWEYRSRKIQQIYNFFEMYDSVQKTCHGFQIFNVEILKELEKYLDGYGMMYKDAIEYSPFEFTWYNVAIQKFRIIPIIEIEPLFKYFHNKEQYINARRRNIRIQDWSRAYIGIVMNSNWNNKGDGYKNPSVLHRGMYFMHILRRKMALVFSKI